MSIDEDVPKQLEKTPSSSASLSLFVVITSTWLIHDVLITFIARFTHKITHGEWLCLGRVIQTLSFS